MRIFLSILMAIGASASVNAAWFAEPIELSFDDQYLSSPDNLGERIPLFLTVTNEGAVEAYELIEGDWVSAYSFTSAAQAEPVIQVNADNDLLIAYVSEDEETVTIYREQFSPTVSNQETISLNLFDERLNSIVGTYQGPVYLLTDALIPSRHPYGIYSVDNGVAMALPELPDFGRKLNIALNGSNKLSLLYGTSESAFDPAAEMKVATYDASTGWDDLIVPVEAAVPVDGESVPVPIWHGYDPEGRLIVYGYIHYIKDHSDSPWWPLDRYKYPQFIGRQDAEGEWNFVSWEGWRVNSGTQAAFTPDNKLHLFANQYPGAQFINGGIYYAEYNQYLVYDGETVVTEPLMNAIGNGAQFSIQADGDVFVFDDQSMYYRTDPINEAIEPEMILSADKESVSWLGESGYHYTVEYSYDLENWHHYDRVYYAETDGQELEATFALFTFSPFTDSLQWKPMFMRIKVHP